MRPCILIAEDDALQSALMQTALESRGYQAEIVINGLEAVRRLRTQQFDLALLDYQMPEVDGLAAARLLRDLMPNNQRPRLIAITAAAEGLTSRGEAGGDAPFDAIVSKSMGLPALLRVVDAHLTSAAQVTAATTRQEASYAETLTRQRLRTAFIDGIPALAVAASLLMAFGVALTLVWHLDQATLSAKQTSALSADTAALIGAVQDAELSERSFLATGSQAEKDQFAADSQRVDQLLVAASPLRPGGMPGADAGPQSLIEAKMKSLAEESTKWHRSIPSRNDGIPSGDDVMPPAEVSHDADDKLREWASNAVSLAQEAVLTGLTSARQNSHFVLAALGIGACYSLWTAVGAMRRRFLTSPMASLGMSVAPSGAARPTLAALQVTLAEKHV